MHRVQRKKAWGSNHTMHSTDSLDVCIQDMWWLYHKSCGKKTNQKKKTGLLLPTIAYCKHSNSMQRLERHGDEVRPSSYPLFVMQKQIGLIWNVSPSAGVLNIHKQVPIFVQNAKYTELLMGSNKTPAACPCRHWNDLWSKLSQASPHFCIQ